MKISIQSIPKGYKIEHFIAKRLRAGFILIDRDNEYLYFGLKTQRNRTLYSVTDKFTGEAFDTFSKSQALKYAKANKIEYITVSSEEGEQLDFIKV